MTEQWVCQGCSEKIGKFRNYFLSPFYHLLPPPGIDRCPSKHPSGLDDIRASDWFWYRRHAKPRSWVDATNCSVLVWIHQAGCQGRLGAVWKRRKRKARHILIGKRKSIWRKKRKRHQESPGNWDWGMKLDDSSTSNFLIKTHFPFLLEQLGRLISYGPCLMWRAHTVILTGICCSDCGQIVRGGVH